MAYIGLKGNLLPESEADFADNIDRMKWRRCLVCGKVFGPNNTHTRNGWKETQITGFCEDCFDNVTKDVG